jgi:hypothetical protein
VAREIILQYNTHPTFTLIMWTISSFVYVLLPSVDNVNIRFVTVIRIAVGYPFCHAVSHILIISTAFNFGIIRVANRAFL